jgi:hypothetical protein
MLAMLAFPAIGQEKSATPVRKPESKAGSISKSKAAPRINAPKARSATSTGKTAGRNSPMSFAEPLGELDKMIVDSWKAASVDPAPLADEYSWLRRVHLDLIGRVPTLEEADAALAMGLSQKKGRRQLVESLLDHPDYPKRFAQIWRNVLIGRNPMGGNDVNGPAFETWLRSQLLQNRPWDVMVRELIAGEGSSKDQGAVNYILAHARFGGARLADPNAATALTGKTSRVFLGLQIQCTQCHDHFLNSTWKQNDFWGMNAFFLGLEREELPRDDTARGNGNRPAGFIVRDRATTAWSMFDRRNATAGSLPPLYLGGVEMPDYETKSRRSALADYVTSKDRTQLAKAVVNRYWAIFMGKGFVNPVDDFGDHNDPVMPEILDHLAEEVVRDGFDLKKLIVTITTSLPYQLSSELPAGTKNKNDTLFARMELKPMSPEQLYDSLISVTRLDESQGAGPEAENSRIAQRQAWVRQFVRNFANDEGGESSEFEGTIPQAMLLMHGPMVDTIINSFRQPDSQMQRLVEKAFTSRQPASALAHSLYARFLSRPPSAREAKAVETAFAQLFATMTYDKNAQPASVTDSPAYRALRMAGEDLSWALLNSNEFILNH